MLDEIAKYARLKSGLSDAGYEAVRKHCFECDCSLCDAFHRYLQIKEAITAWEAYRLKREKHGSS